MNAIFNTGPRPFAMALTVLLVPFQGTPVAEKAGLFEFKRPADWRGQDDPSGCRVLLPPDGSGALVRFLLPEPWSGTPEAYHEALHAALRQDQPVRSGGRIEPFGGFLRSEAVIGAAGGPSLRMALYTAASGGRYQGVLYAAPADDAFAKHKATADRLVRAIGLAAAASPWAPTPVPPADRDVAMTGLWIGGTTDFAYGMDPGGTFSTRLRSRFEILALWANGIAYRGVHDAPIVATKGLMSVREGPAVVDAAALAAQSRPADDRYSRWTEKDGVVSIPANRYGPLELTRQGRNLTTPDGTKWTRLAPVDGARLDGTFVRAATASAPAMRITFRKDGGFEAANVIHALGGPTNNPDFPLQGKGTYEFRKWTLILRFENGFTQPLQFLGSGDGMGDAKALVLAGAEFVRR